MRLTLFVLRGLSAALFCAVLCAVLCACGDDPASPPSEPAAVDPDFVRTDMPALPDLTGIDAEVAELVRAVHAKLSSHRELDTGLWLHYGRVLHAHGYNLEAEVAYVRAAQGAEEARFESLYLAATVLREIDVARSLEHVTAALALRDDLGNAHVLAGVLHEAQSNMGAARRAFERAHATEPTSHSAFGLGRVALANGDHARAIHHFETALNGAPDHHEILAPLARAYNLAGRDADAERTAARVRTEELPTALSDVFLREVLLQGTSYQGYVSRGDDAAANGRRAEAIELFGRAIAKRPQAVETVLSRAVLLAEVGRFEDALIDVRRVLELKVGHAGALCLAARCHVALDRNDEAERALKTALELHPEHRLARYALAQLIAPDRPKKARTLLAGLVGELPEFVEGRLLFARVLADLGETEHALFHVKLVLRKQPENELAAALRTELEQ